MAVEDGAFDGTGSGGLFDLVDQMLGAAFEMEAQAASDLYNLAGRALAARHQTEDYYRTVAATVTAEASAVTRLSSLQKQLDFFRHINLNAGEAASHGIRAAYERQIRNMALKEAAITIGTAGVGRIAVAGGKTLLTNNLGRAAVLSTSIHVGGSNLPRVLPHIPQGVAHVTRGTWIDAAGRMRYFDTGRFAPMGGSTRTASSATHRNSNAYLGDTHVYGIFGPRGVHKIGESSQGRRVSDGASIRGEMQARQLRRETGQRYESDIIANFTNKADARAHERRMIETFRRLYGDEALPGNRSNR